MHHSPVSIGIDIAKDKFDAAFVYEDNSHRITTFENTPKGIIRFITLLKKQRTAATVPCVLESTGHYHLRVALMVAQAGYTVNLINPLITKKYQRSSVRNAKTDAIDALRLAEIGRKEANLLMFHPNISHIQARKLISYLAKLETLKQQLRASMRSVEDMGAVIGMQADLRPTREVIVTLDRQIAALTQHICTLAPPQAAALAKLTPGLSQEKAAVIVSMLGDKRFTHRDQLAAFVGLDVMPRQSGTWRGIGKLSKRGNPYARKVLYQIAWGLKQHNEHYKLVYHRLRTKGVHYTTTLIILARKFLRFLYAYFWKKIDLSTPPPLTHSL